MTKRTSPAPILSRDIDGDEHLLLVVDHPAGMISISDDEMVRILSPAAALALVMDLIGALGVHVPPTTHWRKP